MEWIKVFPLAWVDFRIDIDSTLGRYEFILYSISSGMTWLYTMSHACSRSAGGRRRVFSHMIILITSHAWHRMGFNYGAELVGDSTGNLIACIARAILLGKCHWLWHCWKISSIGVSWPFRIAISIAFDNVSNWLQVRTVTYQTRHILRLCTWRSTIGSSRCVHRLLDLDKTICCCIQYHAEVHDCYMVDLRRVYIPYSPSDNFCVSRIYSSLPFLASQSWIFVVDFLSYRDVDVRYG